MADRSISDFSSSMVNASPLPETGYVRLHQIIGRPARQGRPALAAIIPVSRSTWWAGVKSGRYPQPTRALGERITAWRVEDIRKLVSPGGVPAVEGTDEAATARKGS